MARRNKLWRFAQLQTYPNYREAAADGPAGGPEVIGADGAPRDLRGRWGAEHFGRADAPLTLELACGRGEYTVALAGAYPERNVLGVDVKGARIYHGATALRDAGLANGGFLRTRIERLADFFAVGEVDEVWITFPDPFPRSVNRRLTSPRFWTGYARLVRPGGRVHLKTDDDGLYAYSRQQAPPHFRCAADVDDVYAAAPLPHPDLAHRTTYEGKHLAAGLTIKWLSYERDASPAPEPWRVPG